MINFLLFITCYAVQWTNTTITYKKQEMVRFKSGRY